MPRFYFHLKHGGQLINDPEGSELADAEQARVEAIKAAREIVGAAIRFGIEPPSHAIAVVDSKGEEIIAIPLTEVLPKNSAPEPRGRTKFRCQ